MKAPTHLINFTEPLKEKDNKKRFFVKKYDLNNVNKYIAKLKCLCGSYIFEILYPKKIDAAEPSVIEEDGEFFFLLKARCTSCNSEYILFDADFHGWDGWICHDEKKAMLPRPSLNEWQCKKCSSTKHSAIVVIDSQGKEDFMEEAGDNFDPDKWQDAFDWFTLDIKCEDCKHETRNFISYETM